MAALTITSEREIAVVLATLEETSDFPPQSSTSHRRNHWPTVTLQYKFPAKSAPKFEGIPTLFVMVVPGT